MAISWLLYTNLPNKTRCIDFFTQTYKTKHKKDGGVPFLRLQKSQQKYIVQKFILDWKLFPMINRWGIGGWKKTGKKSGGRLLGTQE